MKESFLLGSTVQLSNRTWVSARHIQQLRVALASGMFYIEAVLSPTGTVPLNGFFGTVEEANAGIDRLTQGFDPGSLV